MTSINMENILIVTVGTRDIQVPNMKELNFRPPNFTLYENKNFPGYKFFSSPFDAGKKIIDQRMSNFVEYPIIKPAIDFVIATGKKISKLILIGTDQRNAEKRFRDSDTIFFSQIIGSLIRNQFANEQVETIEHIEIEDYVTNYEKMFDFFDTKLPSVLKNKDNCNLYIFPQGGIDAINFQVLLKSIELYPNTFHLYKSEANNTIEVSDFPARFRTGIERQNIPVLLEKYYYNNVFSTDGYISALASHAHYRLMSNYVMATNSLRSIVNSQFVSMLRDATTSINADYKLHLKNYYIAIKISFLRGDYSSFLLKVISLIEFFIQRSAEILMKKFGPVELENLPSAKQQAFNDLLREVQRKIMGFEYKNLQYEGYLFNLAVCAYLGKNYYQNRFVILTLKLKDPRNKIAHDATDIALREIRSTLKLTNLIDPNRDPIEFYFEQGDKLFDVIGFGDYDLINEAIKTKLLSNKTT